MKLVRRSGVQHDDGDVEQENPTTCVPVDRMREEIQEMKLKLPKLKPGSMEYLFMNLEYKMKQDNLLILNRVNTASLSTYETKQLCDQMKVETDEITKSLELTQATQDQHQVTINSHSKDIQTIIDKISILECIVEKQAQEIKLLRQVNDDQIARGMKNMIYIHNIIEKVDETNQDTVELVENFFTQEMGITQNIQIAKAVREGPKPKNSESTDNTNYTKPVQPRSILVTLTNHTDKNKIYEHAKNLKGKKNSKGKAFVVTDKLPAGPQELKRSQNDVVKRIKSLPKGENINYKFKKGQLYVNGIKYKASVTHPKVHEIVSPEDQDAVNSTILSQGDRITQEGCSFIAFSQEVRDVEEVRRGYVKIRQLYPEALPHQ